MTHGDGDELPAESSRKSALREQVAYYAARSVEYDRTAHGADVGAGADRVRRVVATLGRARPGARVRVRRAGLTASVTEQEGWLVAQATPAPR